MGNAPSTRWILLKAASVSKHPEYQDYSWKVIQKALSKEYASGLSIAECTRLAVCTFEETKAEPRFLVGNSHSVIDLAFAPLSYPYSPCADIFGPKLDAQLTYEDILNSICKFVLSTLTVSAVNWCREEYDKVAATLPLTKED